MSLMTRLEKIAVKKGIGSGVLLATTTASPIAIVGCVFNPVGWVVPVAAGLACVAATVKACEASLEEIEASLEEMEASLEDTISSVDYFANLEAKVNAAQAISIQYNDEPETIFDVDAELEALKKELGLV